MPLKQFYVRYNICYRNITTMRHIINNSASNIIILPDSCIFIQMEKYSVFFYISAKVFVHFTNIKSFYRGLKYLKFFVRSLHFIKKCKKYTFKNV